MPSEANHDHLPQPLGAAHLAWAGLLCAGGIYGLSASQPANRELAESLGSWHLCFSATGVSAIVSLALLHAWGGQSLRRGGDWPAAITWGLIAAGALLALAALGVLARGMQSRLLLAGLAPLVAVLMTAGGGTLALAIMTRSLAPQGASASDESVGHDDRDGRSDADEATMVRFVVAMLPALLALATLLVAVASEALIDAAR